MLILPPLTIFLDGKLLNTPGVLYIRTFHSHMNCESSGSTQCESWGTINLISGTHSHVRGGVRINSTLRVPNNYNF